MKKIFFAFLCLVATATGNFEAATIYAKDRKRAVRKQTTQRPNIVFILMDDLDSATSPIWDAMVQSKALLRDKGIVFSNAFAPTPICCPARSSILTGKYGHNTGVLTNAGDFGGWETFVQNGNEDRTIAVHLQNAGYKTALMGKYLNGIEEDPNHIPPGWSEWYGFVDNNSYYGYNYAMNENGTIVQYGNDDADYNTDVLKNKAVDFINRAEAQDSQPFFLYVTPTAPHLPLQPARRHQDHPYSTSLSPRKANYNEPDISDKPAWLRLSGDDRASYVQAFNDIDYRNRMGTLYAADEMVAAIYQTLKAKGELANTIIVFTSDNGYNLGAHRLLNKMAPYEESIRIPLVIAGPGIQPSTEGRMTLEIDFAPTFLELAGLSIPNDTSSQDYMDGRSLIPLLRNTPGQSWRNDALLQYVTNGVNGINLEIPPGVTVVGLNVDIAPYKALRTADYTYVEWYDDERLIFFQDAELYDLRRDPFQLQNLLSTSAGRTENAELTTQLKSRLNQLVVCKGDSCR